MVDALEREEIIHLLIRFLSSGEDYCEVPDRGRLSVVQARAALCEIIPTEIQVRGINRRKIKSVIAAPHAGFDHWSEYYCNRLARTFETGWVVALNYRDRDNFRIPVDIGRHIHVNRPTETVSPDKHESHTARAQEVFADYVTALNAAANCPSPPLDLLIEIHSHRRQKIGIEIATSGVDRSFAERIEREYRQLHDSHLPQFAIEPLHELYFSAQAAKRDGSMRGEIAKTGIHIELPRSLRSNEDSRERGVRMLTRIIDGIIVDIESR